MSITRTSRNKRRGLTTIIATLLFVSTVFTALIPLQMSMLQTDTYESKIIRELDTVDDEKDEEELTVVSYPTTTTSSSLKVRVQNTGILDAKIVKIWIKDEQYTVNDTIFPEHCLFHFR